MRHERKVHRKHGGLKKALMCPHKSCKRSSGLGFTRQENLNEHLRRVHQSVDRTESVSDSVTVFHGFAIENLPPHAPALSYVRQGGATIGYDIPSPLFHCELSRRRGCAHFVLSSLLFNSFIEPQALMKDFTLQD